MNDAVPKAERLALLKKTSFGERVAEDEVAKLAGYFVETDQWDRIFKGEIDVVRGDKGSGKSAIYSLLVTKRNDLFDKGILLVTGEKPRGMPVFKDLVADPPTTEQEFVALWKLYIASLIANELKEYAFESSDAKKLIRTLEEEKFLESDFDLSRLLKQARTTVSRWFNPAAIEGTVKFDPDTGIPTFGGKITPAEPNSDLRSKGYLSVDTLAELANRALSAAGYQVWVLLDRLDVAFAESHELERNALRALFRVYRDFADKDCIKLKIFLRSDIWDRIVEGGFREASHITRVVTLDWTSEALLNLIVRRLLSNEMLIDKLEIDKVAVLRDSKAQDAVFYRFFPPQVEQGAKKRPTRDWMINRCEDGHWKTAPRELIHFLNSLRDLELARLERGDALPPGEQLFDRSVFKPALEIVSEARVVQTIYAEYPNLKPYLVELEGEKTEQTIDTLATIWKVSKGEADKRAQALVEIGFFEQRGGRDNWTYWVPFLYRDALHMSQGLAEE